LKQQPHPFQTLETMKLVLNNLICLSLPERNLRDFLFVSAARPQAKQAEFVNRQSIQKFPLNFVHSAY
jgi:hypothetical protein